MGCSGMGRKNSRLALAGVLAAVFVGVGELAAQSSEPAVEHVRRAVDLMGGEEALRAAERVRLEMTTQWQRPDYGAAAFRDRPSFELHDDVRDYSIPAWRNTRDFGTRTITNVVRDSVAVTDMGDGPQPLSVAYVDERDELFVYTPDRLVLALLDAPDLHALGDTLIGGERHRRVGARLAARYPSTIYLHAGSGLPTRLSFRAGHFADFGLVPLGEMDVDVWYSGWRTFGGISIPTQWDVWRSGARYKRMTVRSADFAPHFVAADSFSVSPEERADWLASAQTRPMHESVPVEEPAVHDGFVALGGFGMPAGAIDTGAGWLLLGTGQASFNYDRALHLLRPAGVDRIRAVLVAEGRIANGGVRRAVENAVPVFASMAAEPLLGRMLRGERVARAHWTTVTEPVELGAGPGRVVIAPVDLPDVPGAAMLYRPQARWLWVPDAVTPLDVRIARARAESLGWRVERVGTPRDLGLDGPGSM